MTNYISGDLITAEISTLQFFPIEYFNKYIKNFTSKNKLINSKNIKLINKSSPLIFITKIEYLDDFYNQIVTSLNTKFVKIIYTKITLYTLTTNCHNLQEGIHSIF